ncbi:DnaD domain-containing protein [Weissella halotolerans]|uniref:Primosome component related protein n=1 Tax=Weissella halotolerans DSM 20190 TaxID=1123500 RepID=A0A0R2G7V7_9LACO|nr:DnaD domain protein [Weissella halotolerans]KRN33575.1 primosome component related protein [Weissella halotolerans DSM 20190]
MSENEPLQAFFNAPQVVINTFLLAHYRQLGMSNDEFLLLLQVQGQVNEYAGDIKIPALKERLGWPEDDIRKGLTQLHHKGFINFISQRDGQGKVITKFDFSPLYLKAMQLNPKDLPAVSTQARLATEGAPTASSNQNELTRADIFNAIEREFGRPLSSIELQTITNWFDIDHFQPIFMQAALQEAVLNGALNLRYIETILVAWQKKNYHSLQDVYQEKRQRQGYKQSVNQTTAEVPLDVDLTQIDLDSLSEGD